MDEKEQQALDLRYMIQFQALRDILIEKKVMTRAEFTSACMDKVLSSQIDDELKQKLLQDI